MELVSYRMPWAAPLKIMPVGDIQWGGRADEVVIEKLAAHIAWGVKEGAWFIGMGDYIDTHSPSNRAALKSLALHDSSEDLAMDEGPKMLVNQLFDQALKPSVGRWLGLLAGHHYSNFIDGTTSDQYLAGKLKTRFLGDSAYVRLLFQRGKRGGGSDELLIWCHHGTGSGVSVGSPILKLERLPASWAGDVFLMGHQSKLVAVPVDRLRPQWSKSGSGGRLAHETVLLVGTGGFLKGYAAGRMRGRVPTGSYVEKGMMRPVALGGPLITITPRRAGKADGWHWSPDLRVSL